MTRISHNQMQMKKKTDPKVNEALRKAVNTAISIKSSEEGMLI